MRKIQASRVSRRCGPLSLSLFLALSGCAGAKVTDNPAASPAVSPAAGAAASVVPEPPPGPRLPGIEFASDAEIGRLAETALSGGDEARAALDTAIAASGFGVMDTEGKVVLEPQAPSQGLAFGVYEVDGLAGLAARGFSTPLNDFADVVAAPLAELHGAPVASMLLEDIRAAATSETPTVRYWSHFIIELGRQHGDDLMGEVDPGAVRLDALQLGFISRRLQGDLLTFADGASANGASVALAGGYPPGAGRRVPLAVKLPCQPGDTESVIRDAGALIATEVFEQVMGHLEGKGMKIAGKLAKVAGLAGTIQGYVEVLIQALTFKANFQLQPGSQPFVRTRSTEAGEERLLSATPSFNLGAASSVANCLRIAMNAMGLDFSLPNDGPIARAEVEWKLLGNAGEFLGIGRPETDLLPDDDGVIDTDVDGEGHSAIWIRGRPQEEDLPEDVQPNDREAVIGVEVVVQPHNLFQDLVDAVSVGAGGLRGLVLKLPPEVLQRTDWLFVEKYRFTVRDWSEGWLVEAHGHENYGPNFKDFKFSIRVSESEAGSLLGGNVLTGDGVMDVTVGWPDCQLSGKANVRVFARRTGLNLSITVALLDPPPPRDAYCDANEMTIFSVYPREGGKSEFADRAWSLDAPAEEGTTTIDCMQYVGSLGMVAYVTSCSWEITLSTDR